MQLPAAVEATLLDVHLGLLVGQVSIVALMGVAMVFAEWAGINRWRLPPPETDR